MAKRDPNARNPGDQPSSDDLTHLIGIAAASLSVRAAPDVGAIEISITALDVAAKLLLPSPAADHLVQALVLCLASLAVAAEGSP